MIGSNLWQNFDVSVRICIGHGGIFGPISVRIGIEHVTEYSRVLADADDQKAGVQGYASDFLHAPSVTQPTIPPPSIVLLPPAIQF
jgi:hypothetical protein